MEIKKYLTDDLNKLCMSSYYLKFLFFLKFYFYQICLKQFFRIVFFKTLVSTFLSLKSIFLIFSIEFRLEKLSTNSLSDSF